MTDPGDPGERASADDWRTEVDWSRVRRLAVLHGVYWAFGAAQAVLYRAGFLTGGVRTLFGAVDYLAWAALLVLSFRVVARTHRGRGSAARVSGRTFLILVAFIASLGAYLVLLAAIEMDTITLL